MLTYAKIENEQTKTVSIGTGTNTAFYESIGMKLMDVERGYDGQHYVKGYAPKQSIEELIDQTYNEFDSKVKQRLNDFAKTRRYDSIYTASDYKDSHIEKYAAEGKYCYRMLAETYSKCEELLAEYIPLVLAGKRPIPSWEEIDAQLPALMWPDERVEELAVTTEEITEQEPTYIPNEVTNASN